MITDCRSITRSGLNSQRIFEFERNCKEWVRKFESNLLPVEVKHCEELYRKRKTRNIMLLRYKCDVLTLVNEV
jgi:hypothetical protein